MRFKTLSTSDSKRDNPAMASLLEVEDLNTRIKLRSGTVHAVDGLSFEVDSGETLGIVGESGCGKTMAAMSIMRLLPRGGYIERGAIRLAGRDLVPLPDSELRKIRGDDIGIVFQDPMTSLNPTMTIGRQIAEGVLIHRDVSKDKAMERAVEVLDLVGLPRPSERIKDYPHQLSGGLRQRVMIAMALACDPKLLIADEPTTALDVTIQAQILDLLDKIKSELGMAIVLITHDMGVIAGRADRVAVMYAGRKVETAETVELFTKMRHPYTEALLASIPQLDQDKSQELYSIPGLPPDLRRPPLVCRFAPRCAFATEKCRTEDPPLGGEDPNHPYACFYPRHSSVEAMGDLGAELLAQAERNKALVATFGKELALLETAAEPELAPVGTSDGVVLEFKNVTKEFPVTAGAILRRRIATLHAVTDVDLSIRRGETFGLVGESGCGKTTLGRMGVGLEVPTTGEVVFNGTALASLKGGEFRERRRDLQFMFQDPYASLDPRMRVREIISEPLDIAHEGTAQERLASVRRLLDEVGLAHDTIDRYPARVLGRPAAAPRARPRARDQPQGDHRRRARLGARRLDPLADPEPDEKAPGNPRAHLHRDLARSVGRALRLGPDRRDVPRQAGRDWSGERRLREAGPSLHRRPARGDSGAEPRDRQSLAQSGRARRAPVAAEPALGLPLSDPLPARQGALRRGRARAAPVRPGPPRCVPLPASDA